MGTMEDTSEVSEFRQRAEKQLEIELESTEAFSEMSHEKMATLIHELQVHQIELKMQNNALRSTRDELEKSRDRYSDLYDFAPIGYFSMNQKGVIHEANLTFASMLSVDRSALIGQPFTRFILSDDQDIFYKHRRGLQETEAPRSSELRLVKNDGHVFYVRLECMVIESEDDGLKQIRMVVSDITERKQAEWALEASYSLMKIGESLAQLGFFERNWQTGEGQWSEGFYRLLGLTNQEARTHEEFTKFIHEDDRQRVSEHIQETLRTKKNMDIEFQLVQTNGNIVNIHGMGINSYDEEGKPLLTRGTFQDISERKRADQEKEKLKAQLQQSQKMEAIGTLAGGVAHDYNNALSVITGFTQLTIDEVDPTGPLRDNLGEVLKAAKRATDITGQLLAFARKQTIAPKVLDLNENVESMLKMLRRLIGEDINLVWSPGASLWPLKMDPTQIGQILVNLCVNARDAIENVGKLSIETSKVAIDKVYCADHDGFVPGEFVLLAVSDNGCGMDKEIVSNIFEPFFTTKDIDKGTGLGMATVYGIVKQNNGFINVYSEPGKGTTIKIYLPRHEGKFVDVQGESVTETPQGQGETILLVEDDLSLLNLASKILEGLGYTVLTSKKPDKVMGLAEEHPGKIHLLITDVIMPEMNGRELAEQLQSLYPDIKCVFMSGYTADIIAHHGVLKEGVKFIQKPFSKRDLATAVRKALDE